MNLRDQLKEVLPEILPRNPAESIKGTELIRLVEYRLRQEYADATLRYHFSILCCDPSSPIAKVDQGQGYYLRQNRLATMSDPRTLAAAGLGGGDLFQSGREAVDLALSRVAKFRALFARLVQADARFALALSPGPSPESLWKYPDFAVVDWEVDEAAEQGFAVSRELLDLKARLGVQPFTVTGVKLAMMVTYDNVREVFFQALSASRWAHTGELVVAAGIADEQLVEDLRRLGAGYGLGVSTLGCKPEALDEIEDAAALGRLDDRGFEVCKAGCWKGRKLPPRGLHRRLTGELSTTCVENTEISANFWRGSSDVCEKGRSGDALHNLQGLSDGRRGCENPLTGTPWGRSNYLTASAILRHEKICYRIGTGSGRFFCWHFPAPDGKIGTIHE